MKLLHLKSGTDVRGSAINPENPTEIDLSNEAVRRIVSSFVHFLAEETGKEANTLRISVGHDSRLSAERIRTAVLQELTAYGVESLDCGLSSTPAMFMTTQTEHCDGAVQITASHHPWKRNGLKFFLPSGSLSGAQLTEILSFAEENASKASDASPIETTPLAYTEIYASILRDMIQTDLAQDGKKAEKPLQGLKIVVDAGNGVGGFYASKVLEPLGADVAGSQFLEPDGTFPNHAPNPENEAAIESLKEATLQAHADLGVIFDTDADRGGAVTADGEELNRNRLVAAAAAIALETHPKATVVTDSVTWSGLTTFIEQKLGGKHIRFKRGYKNVIDEAKRRMENGEDTPLAIETSGHAAFSDNYFLDDGAYLVTKLIVKLCALKKENKSLDDLIEGLEAPLEESEIRLSIKKEDFKAYGNAVIARLEEKAQQTEGVSLATDSFEGTKVIFDTDAVKGFFIFRLSVHDPVIPVNFFADTQNGVREMAAQLKAWLSEESGLDLSAFAQIS